MNVRAFAVLPDETEELNRTGAGSAKPVRYASVELDNFARAEKKIMLAEDEAKCSVEDVDPIVPLMDAKIGLVVVLTRWKHELVGLRSSLPACEGENDRTIVTLDRPQVYPWIARAGRVDKVIERDTMRASQRKQLL